MKKFDTILVANRGEIAIRIMATAKALGFKTIAIFSTADSKAMHVEMADDAILIGPGPVDQSYLDINRIMEAAKKSGAQAIHPGYGFLSENAEFARACNKAGIVFIGPDADSIDLMGNKAAAKRHMIKFGMPCIPGYEDEDQKDETLTKAASQIGYPIMIKAAAGGGGRGMRLVEDEPALCDGLKSARSEALSAFGSQELILEKAIICARHVEFQIFCDTHGNGIHLGERDCSLQRRHQKIVEEAPCPVMDDQLRDNMGNAALSAAKSIGYHGAGTIEFLLDSDRNFYFLEMNTRLQVEHAVTEMITGLDLVALQIQVAGGDRLGLKQADVKFNGHAIEARLYAEDPTSDFLPCTGKVEMWKPATGEGLRIDSGINSGQEISSFYDPMIAKAIGWGETREIARHRLIKGLRDLVYFGPVTNREFLIDILSKDRFVKGEATTSFIKDETYQEKFINTKPDLKYAAIAAILQYYLRRKNALAKSINVSHQLLNWSSGEKLVTHFNYEEDQISLNICALDKTSYQICSADEIFEIDLLKINKNTARLAIDGRRVFVQYMMGEKSANSGQISMVIEGKSFMFNDQSGFSSNGQEISNATNILAPMHGTMLQLYVKTGEQIATGARIGVLEAMKMQHDIVAKIGGHIRQINIQPGDQVASGDLLVEIEPAIEIK